MPRSGEVYCRIEDGDVVAYLRKNVTCSGSCRSLLKSRKTRLYLFKSQIEERAGMEAAANNYELARYSGRPRDRPTALGRGPSFLDGTIRDLRACSAGRSGEPFN